MHLQLHKAFDHMTRTAQRAFRWKPYKMKKVLYVVHARQKTRTQSLFLCFVGERRLGVRFRRTRGAR